MHAAIHTLFSQEHPYGFVRIYADIDWWWVKGDAERVGMEEVNMFDAVVKAGCDASLKPSPGADPQNVAQAVAVMCVMQDTAPEYLDAFPQGSVGERLHTQTESHWVSWRLGGFVSGQPVVTS